MRRVQLVLLALFVLPSAAQAQSVATGRLVGRVIDAATGSGITDAGIQVVGTTIGGMSGVEGRFALGGVPAGTVTLTVRRIGYAPKTITGIYLEGGRTLPQDVSLAQASVQLTAQVVTAESERGFLGARRAGQVGGVERELLGE